MPHTARKRKPQTRKRAEVTGEDGWTRVTHSGRSTNSVVSHRNDASEVPPQDPNATIESLRKSFDKKLASLRDDPHLSGEIERILPIGYASENSLPEHDYFLVDKGVCLALGSLSSDNLSHAKNSMWQLAAFVWLTRLFAKHASKNSVPMYAQEPRFSLLDKQFLASLGITVLENDAALSQIDPVTFLYAPCMDYPIETPYRVRAAQCQIYLTSSMDWVIESTEFFMAQSRYSEMDASQREELNQTLNPLETVESAKFIKEKFEAMTFPNSHEGQGLDSTFYRRTETPESLYWAWLQRARARREALDDGGKELSCGPDAILAEDKMPDLEALRIGSDSDTTDTDIRSEPR